jgi:hypothetical protein
MLYTESRLFIYTPTKFTICQLTCHFIFIKDSKLLLHTKLVIKIAEQTESIILLSRLRELEFSRHGSS